MKFLVGFILGLLTISAVAQVTYPIDGRSFIRASGDGIDKNMHVIQTDNYGYVICSQVPPPDHWLHGGDHDTHEK